MEPPLAAATSSVCPFSEFLCFPLQPIPHGVLFLSLSLLQLAEKAHILESDTEFPSLVPVSYVTRGEANKLIHLPTRFSYL